MSKDIAILQTKIRWGFRSVLTIRLIRVGDVWEILICRDSCEEEFEENDDGTLEVREGVTLYTSRVSSTS